MAKIISTGTPSPEDLKQNIFKNLWEDFKVLDRGMKFVIFSGIFLIVFGVYAARNVLETRQHAGGGGIGRVDIHPGVLELHEDNNFNTEMSTLAYNIAGDPIWDGVYYEWSTSSTNSVGTLTKVVGNITEYDPLKAGCGVVNVTARLGDETLTKSIQVAVQPARNSGLPDIKCETEEPTPTVTGGPPQERKTIQIQSKADAHVRSNAPSKNYGSSNEMWIDGKPDSVAYIKFDLLQLAGKEILNAKLQLRVANVNDAQSNGTFQIFSVKDNSWKQKNIVYTNKPSLDSQIGSFSNPKKQQDVEIDISDYIKSEGEAKSLAIKTSSTDGTVLRSKEAQSASNRPTLVVEYVDLVSSQPEPAPDPVTSSPGEKSVVPVIYLPKDFNNSSYVGEVKKAFEDVQAWYKENLGRTFTLGEIVVYKSDKTTAEILKKYPNGSNPETASIRFDEELPKALKANSLKICDSKKMYYMVTPINADNGGASGKEVFGCQNRFPGFAVIPTTNGRLLGGILDPKEIEWWMNDGIAARGAVAHELGHLFGSYCNNAKTGDCGMTPHPDWDGPHSIMNYWWDYRNPDNEAIIDEATKGYFERSPMNTFFNR